MTDRSSRVLPDFMRKPKPKKRAAAKTAPVQKEKPKPKERQVPATRVLPAFMLKAKAKKAKMARKEQKKKLEAKASKKVQKIKKARQPEKKKAAKTKVTIAGLANRLAQDLTADEISTCLGDGLSCARGRMDTGHLKTSYSQKRFNNELQKSLLARFGPEALGCQDLRLDPYLKAFLTRAKRQDDPAAYLKSNKKFRQHVRSTNHCGIDHTGNDVIDNLVNQREDDRRAREYQDSDKSEKMKIRLAAILAQQPTPTVLRALDPDLAAQYIVAYNEASEHDHFRDVVGDMVDALYTGRDGKSKRWTRTLINARLGALQTLAGAADPHELFDLWERMHPRRKKRE